MTEHTSEQREMLLLMYRIFRTFLEKGTGEDQTHFGDMSLTQINALRSVKVRGAIEMGELAEELNITRASASTLADRLVKGGWLERVTDEHDRRIIRLKLSPDAKAKFTKMLDCKALRLQTALETLSPDDRTSLKRILTSLEDHLITTK